LIESAAIDALLQAAVDRRTLPGVVAVAGDRDGAVYEGAFGRLAIDGDTPVQGDTTVAIASMTKAITSVAALQLIEQGRLALEQTVASVLPEFAKLSVLDGFDGEAPRLRAPATQATIRQLLTHTSGLGYWFADADLLRFHQVEAVPDPLSGRRDALDRAPLVCDPGTRWTYGTSVDWLGQVVEALAGQDLDAYCKQHIFAPLGMTDTTFAPSDSQRERLMRLHERTADGGLDVSPIELPFDPEFYSGGGGACSTGRDYLRFMRALLRGGELDGERILSPRTVELIFTDHLGGLPLPALTPSALPRLTNEVPALPVAQGWGLGLQLLLEDIPGMRRAGSGFWAGLFNCYYWIDPPTGIAAAILTQVLAFFDARIVETMLSFNAALFAAVDERAPGA
jgi:methyl acetate hydrolase